MLTGNLSHHNNPFKYFLPEFFNIIRPLAHTCCRSMSTSAKYLPKFIYIDPFSIRPEGTTPLLLPHLPDIRLISKSGLFSITDNKYKCYIFFLHFIKFLRIIYKSLELLYHIFTLNQIKKKSNKPFHLLIHVFIPPMLSLH